MQIIPKNDEVVSVTIRIRKTVDRAVEIERTRLDVTKQQLIEEALIEKLGLKEADAA